MSVFPNPTAAPLAGLSRRSGPGLRTAERWDAAAAAPRWAEEAALVAQAAEPRRREFLAGRLCARRALARLGAPAGPLLRGADRRPLWPAGFTGSITHTPGYCAAAVARTTQVAAVGVDAEHIDAVQREIWPRILTAAELDDCRRAPDGAQALRAALAFSAKEAAFKCQYPLTGRWLGFHDLTIRAERGGVFLAEPADLAGDAALDRLRGVWAVRHGLVLTLARIDAA